MKLLKQLLLLLNDNESESVGFIPTKLEKQFILKMPLFVRASLLVLL